MSFTDDLSRGVNPYKRQAKECALFLLEFMKSPLEGMTRIPKWDWPTLLVFYASIAAISGILNGLIGQSFSGVIAGIFVMPISATIGAALLSGFFYYTFQYFFKKELSFHLLYTIVALANLPAFAIYTLARLLPGLTLVGFAAAGILLIVGLTYHSQIDRKRIAKLVGTLYVLYFIFWAISFWTFRTETRQIKSMATPESYEQLKKEFED